jgi:hypothetical protein
MIPNGPETSPVSLVAISSKKMRIGNKAVRLYPKNIFAKDRELSIEIVRANMYATITTNCAQMKYCKNIYLPNRSSIYQVEACVGKRTSNAVIKHH